MLIFQLILLALVAADQSTNPAQMAVVAAEAAAQLQILFAVAATPVVAWVHLTGLQQEVAVVQVL
jgi:hypothetical protein